MITGWYYLHTNGELIYKPDSDTIAGDLRESDFVRAMWIIDLSNRVSLWNILVEALALKANKSRIEELAKKWKCDNKDAEIYAQHIGLAPLKMDGDQWCATLPSFINLQESEAGYGDSALEALADLCQKLGYKEGKMWNSEFKDLILRNKGLHESKRTS